MNKKLTDEQWNEAKRLRNLGKEWKEIAGIIGGVTPQNLSSRFKREGQGQLAAPQKKTDAAKLSRGGKSGAAKLSRAVEAESFAQRAVESVRPRGRGRPTVYQPEYAQMLLEYFEGFEPYEVHRVYGSDGQLQKFLIIPNKPLSLSNFAVTLGVDRSTLQDWAEAKNSAGELKHPEFSHSYKIAKTYIESSLFEGGMVGAYQSNMAKFAMMNLVGWKEQGKDDFVDSASTGPSEAELDAEFESAMAEAEEKHAALLGRTERFSTPDQFADPGDF